MKPVSFEIPEGYQVPEGIEDGQTFDESVTFKIAKGKLTLSAVNGVPLDKEKNEEGEKAVSDTASTDLAARYAAAMASPQS